MVDFKELAYDLMGNSRAEKIVMRCIYVGTFALSEFDQNLEGWGKVALGAICTGAAAMTYFSPPETPQRQ